MKSISNLGAAVTAALLIGGPMAHVSAQSYKVGAAATASPAATAIAEQIFAQGGTAVDAAVAVGFALAVSYPEAGNIGGGGFAVVCDAKSGQVVTLDFRETAPSAASEKMYLDAAGNVMAGLSLVGAKASGVPGTVAGLHELWKKYGTMPWEKLVEPAAQLADTGVIVTDYLAKVLAQNEGRLTTYGSTSAIYLRRNLAPDKGDRLAQKDLAKTLRLIGAQGPDAFYKGEIARQIVACMRAHAGLITAEDLASYKPVWREPTHVTFDSLDVYSMNLPSSGGVCVGQILKLLEPYDFSKYTSTSPEYVHLFCEASKLTYADRSTHLGDPAFYKVPNLLDSGYIAARRKLINPDTATPSAQVRPGDTTSESVQTTHYSVCDSAGNMVAITYTLNTSFGSGLVVEGAGFLLNNEMDDFSIKPGVPNVYGLIGGVANKIEPGKRMLSSMAPTVILKNGKPHLIVGTPGGSRIITTVAEAILNFVRFGRTPNETVSAPRFHHQWLPDVLYLEEASWSPAVTSALQAMGYKVEKQPAWCDVELIAIDSAGVMTPAADPRKDGRAGGI